MGKLVDLANRINEHLDWAHDFQKYRKQLHGLGSVKEYIFLQTKEKERDYFYHFGGRKEIQFNLGLEGEGEWLRYGLAIEYAKGPGGKPDPERDLKPIIEVFNKADKEKFKEQGFRLYRHPKPLDTMEFTEYEEGDFLFFGKHIEWKDGNLEEEEFKEIIKTFKKLLPFYKRVMEEALNLKEIREEAKGKFLPLLKTNKQLIFTGAPGTGKTFKAREIARAMVEDDYGYDDLRIDFVQFHPSYDYADFVEGLKPFKDKDGSDIQFRLCNGSFKEFCRKAGVIDRIKYLDEDKEVSKKALEKFLSGNEKAIDFWIEWLKNNSAEGNNRPPFVFIIDEINRADLSKVFGELFYAIEPDYRGKPGIKTQYSFLNNDETFFVDPENDYFFVPENVYIIGTMNDIDRSVEVFDFAIRRRFVWYEIMANKEIENILRSLDVSPEIIEEAKKRLKNLNEKIEANPHFNKSYHIGPAYFLKLENYKESEAKWDALWEFHIEPLLKEYLRGMPDFENQLEDLKEGYYRNAEN